MDLGIPISATPYEPYMRPVKQVLQSLHGPKGDMGCVRKLLKTGRNFKYILGEPYIAALPTVTAERKEGDCKGKALWLADQLGDPSVRFVIGNAKRESGLVHAWLIWNDGSTWWILDPTNRSEPLRADKLSSAIYVPNFIYSQRETRVTAEGEALTQQSNGQVSAQLADR